MDATDARGPNGRVTGSHGLKSTATETKAPLGLRKWSAFSRIVRYGHTDGGHARPKRPAWHPASLPVPGQGCESRSRDAHG